MDHQPTLSCTCRCPTAGHCTCCRGTDGLAVVVFDSPLGVSCATLCEPCISAGVATIKMDVISLAGAVALHCGHLGLDLDQAGKLLAAERARKVYG